MLSVYYLPILKEGAFLVIQTVKHLPAMRETWVRSLGQEENGAAEDEIVGRHH